MATGSSEIQNKTLEITVVGCNNLKDTEWFTRQDPYVILEYGTTKLRTKTCTDGDKNPSFNEKFQISLIEGLLQINISVWNSNTMMSHTYIGSGRVELHKVVAEGYSDIPCPIKTATGGYAGQVNLIMHFSRPALQRSVTMCVPPTQHHIPPYIPPVVPQAPFPPYMYQPESTPCLAPFYSHHHHQQIYPPEPYPPEPYPPVGYQMPPYVQQHPHHQMQGYPYNPSGSFRRY